MCDYRERLIEAVVTFVVIAVSAAINTVCDSKK